MIRKETTHTPMSQDLLPNGHNGHHDDLEDDLPFSPSERATGALEAFEEGRVSPVDVARLSDLDRTALHRFASEWETLPPTTREQIVRVMGELSEDRIELQFGRPLRVALADPDASVRQRALASLWEDDRPDLLERYRSLLADDPSNDVRAAAAEALGRFANRAATGEIDEALAEQIRTDLLRYAADTGEDHIVRRRSLESAGFFGDDPAVEQAIREAFDDEDSGVQASALFAMGQSASKRWLPILINELANSDAELRFEAARACGQLGDPIAVAELLECAKDEDKDVRFAAINALGAIGGKSARRALERLADEGGEAEMDAIEAALEEIRTEADLLQEQE